MAMDDTLAMVELFLLNTPLQTGHSPKRWRMALDVMLKKKKNEQDVTALCTIGSQRQILTFSVNTLGDGPWRKQQSVNN